MFKFRFILDYFQYHEARGPTVEANTRAKWLSELCPADLQIAFAPNQGQVPLYSPEIVQLVDKEAQGWWNHYSFSRFVPESPGNAWSLGPNIDPSLRPPGHIPLAVYSQYQLDNLLKRWNGLKNTVHIIPVIVDPARFHPGPKEKRITVGWIGNDHPIRMTKGVEVIPYLAERFPDIQFEMIHGSKPKFMHEWLPRLLPNLRIRSEVPHHLMPEVVRRWHVQVCASKWENGPAHVVEALASGVPVIAASVGAIPEVAPGQMLLNDMKWGQPPQVARPYDWTKESLERFADALDRLLTDTKLYELKKRQALDAAQLAAPVRIAQKWFDFIYDCQSACQ